MIQKDIRVLGGREHNLKNIDITIPRDQFVVLTGVSGSGKSSLAFDTIYAEGQRRYVESLSTHARTFLGQMNKPEVDSIEGLSPSISIQQRVAAGSPRSTVGTQTEIYDYTRLLYARIGQPHCHRCGVPIHSQTSEEIVEQILIHHQGETLQIMSPVVHNKRGAFVALLKDLQKAGFTRGRVDGAISKLADVKDLKKNLTHDIDVIIDRLIVKEDSAKRLNESVKVALDMGHGVMVALFGEKDFKEISFSELNACKQCEISIGEMVPGMFSFNSPHGACPMCHGLGKVDLLNPELMVVDEDRSILEGVIPVITHEDVPMVTANKQILQVLARRYRIDLEAPWRDLSEEQRDVILYGAEDAMIRTSSWKNGREVIQDTRFEGFCKRLFDRFHTTEKTQPKDIIKRYMSPGVCLACEGMRLKPESLAVKIDGYRVYDFTEQPLEDLMDVLDKLKLSPKQLRIGQDILKEIRARLQFLIDVGLGYLTLSRASNTLAGGEAQRIKLATQIGSGLMGVLYVLDEPSIGLHSRDNGKLLRSLKRLQAIGNSILVVEHDEETIRSADHLIEMGPDAGVGGGHVVFQGTLQEMLKTADTKTAKYLRRDVRIPIPEKRRQVNPDHVIVLTGCEENNLKNIDVVFPLGVLMAVTGVSGSGKSSLVDKILHRALRQKLSRSKKQPGLFKKIRGYDQLETVVEISQSAIGRTPRSNPATYTGVFDLIREWYARLPEAKVRGLKSSHFSFNIRGGRCEACSGDGAVKIEMHFLPDVYVPCEVCNGKRYQRDILEVKYQGQSVSEVLDSTVEEAIETFKNVPPILEKLELIRDVGLSYIKLGQPATTLSGGEAQRIKLASELGNRTKGPTVYILDEPTTGLHFADIHNLLEVLQRLVSYGHTVVVIEHNLEVIYASDYVIDLGPGGGNRGGEVVAEGTPEDVMAVARSYTGESLVKHVETLNSPSAV